MFRPACLLLVLLAALTTHAVPQEPSPTAATTPRYETHAELTATLQKLAADYPRYVRLTSIGKSLQRRELWLLTITDSDGLRGADDPELLTRNALLATGGMHGNEVSGTPVLIHCVRDVLAHAADDADLAAWLRRSQLFVVPCVNPDSADVFIAGGTRWRPRGNQRGIDLDGDGKLSEDGYEDINGDGAITMMRRTEADGTHTLLGWEGLDNDGDGKVNEDIANGVDLNRNFPEGWKAGSYMGSSRGESAASEPESAALVAFVESHPQIALVADYHNQARCIFYRLADGAHGTETPENRAVDMSSYQPLLDAGQQMLGYDPMRMGRAGIFTAWTYEQRGIPSIIVELDNGIDQHIEGRATDEKIRAEYIKRVGRDPWIEWAPFDHPQLGMIEVGGEFRQWVRRNPPLELLPDLCQRNVPFFRRAMQHLPRLELSVVGRHGNAVELALTNQGGIATTTQRGAELQRPGLICGDAQLPVLAPGESHTFTVTAVPDQDTTVVAGSAFAGVARLTIPARTGYPPAAPASPWRAPGGARTTATLHRATCGPWNDGVFTGATPTEPNVVTSRPRDVHLGVILVEFPDFAHDPRFTRDNFDRMLFSLGEYHADPTGKPAAGSLRDFYREMSYGLVDITGRVFDWVTVPTPKAEQLARPMINNPYFRLPAIQALIERDGDDVKAALDACDGLVFICAGNPDPRPSGLWPHRGKIGDKPYIQLSEIQPRTTDQFLGVGVPCHEFGHTFGFKDMYGLRNTRTGPGPFSLMANGTHSWAPGDDNFPFHMDAWCKAQIGWVEPQVIDPRVSQRIALRPIGADRRECIKLLIREDGSEYYLLEVRRAAGSQQHFPAPGLLIWHVGERRCREKFPIAEMDVVLESPHGRETADAANRYAPWMAWPLADRTSFTPTKPEGGLDVRLSEIEVGEDDSVSFVVGSRRAADPTYVEHGGLVALTHGAIRRDELRRMREAGEEPPPVEPRTLHATVILADTPGERFMATNVSSRDMRREAERLWFSEGEYYKTDLDDDRVHGSINDWLDEASLGMQRVAGTVMRSELDSDPWFRVAGDATDAGAFIAATLQQARARGESVLRSYTVHDRRANTDTTHAYNLIVICTPWSGAPTAIHPPAVDGEPPVLLVTGCHDNLGRVGEILPVLLQWMLGEGAAKPVLGGSGTQPTLGGFPLRRALFGSLGQPLVLDRGITIPENYFLLPGELFGGALRFRLDQSGENGDDALVVECRQRIGFDSALPGEGLMVWRGSELLATLQPGSEPFELRAHGRVITICNVWRDAKAGYAFTLYSREIDPPATGTRLVAMPEFGTYFVLHIPAGYDTAGPDRAWPLILDYHGAAHPSVRPAIFSEKAWRKLPDERGYVLVLPQSRKRAWGSYTWPEGKDEIDFHRAVLERVNELVRIDPARVLLTGFSSGADFDYSLLASHPEGIRAVASFNAGVFHERGLADVAMKRPVMCITGGNDLPRKQTVFRAWRELSAAGFDATYREVPGNDHRFPPVAEYARVLDWFESLDRPAPDAATLLAGAVADREAEDTHRALARLRTLAGMELTPEQRTAADELQRTIAAEGAARVDATIAQFADDATVIEAYETMRLIMTAYAATEAGSRAATLVDQWRNDARYRAALAERRANKR